MTQGARPLRYRSAMTMTPEFVSRLLESTQSGYAGLAAATILETGSEGAAGAGEASFDLWKGHFEQRLGELAAALAFETPQLFAAGVTWSRVAFSSRGVPADELLRSLDVLEEVLSERLHEDAHPVVAPYFLVSRRALEAPVGGREELESSDDRQHLILSYAEAALRGDSRLALHHLVQAMEEGLSVLQIFEDVLVPAQRELGRLWHTGELNVAEEHLATAVTEKAASVLAHRVDLQPENGKSVLAACVAGNAHGLGLRLLVEIFEIKGWRSVLLGSDVPLPDLLEATAAFAPDLVVLSASLSSQLRVLRTAIEALRRQGPGGLKIVAGGRAFAGLPELYRKVGADGSAPTLSEALALAARLTGVD